MIYRMYNPYKVLIVYILLLHCNHVISESGGKPTEEKSILDLQKFLFNEKSTVITYLHHLIVAGVPACGKTTTIHKLLSDGLTELPPGETVATIGERNDTGLSIFELIALCPDKEWVACTKYTFFTFCILSAFVLESNFKHVIFERPDETYLALDSQPFLDSPLLQDHFKELYYRLYRFTNIPSFKSMTPEGLQNLLKNGIVVVNIWDIGVNIALQQMLPQLAGYLHYSFPILALSLDCDSESLTKSINISDKKYGSDQTDIDIITKEKIKASYLFKFAQLARQGNNNRQVCKIVFLTKEPDTKAKQEEAETLMRTKILPSAEKFGICALIDKKPILCNNKSRESVLHLRIQLEDAIIKIKNEKSMPISWIFLRSAALASGKMFIEYEEFKGLAQECHISEDSFKDFLTTFTAMGSLIYIPEIEVFKQYIVLNPFDFFNKLNELFRPRFNGDLRYGIIRMLSLRKMFGLGETFSFFKCLLESCLFAIELEAKRIMYNDTTELISVEECFYVPAIRKLYYQKPCDTEHSLLILTDYVLPPPLAIIKNLLECIGELKLLASPYYNVTSFIYNKMKFDLISHGNAIELHFSEVAADKTKSEFYSLIEALRSTVSKPCFFAIPCMHSIQIHEKSYESKEAHHLLLDFPTHEVCARNQWMRREVCCMYTRSLSLMPETCLGDSAYSNNLGNVSGH